MPSWLQIFAVDSGMHGIEQSRRDAQGFGRRVERAIRASACDARRSLRQLPGRLLHDELVHRREQCPDRLQAAREFEIVEGVERGCDRLRGERRDVRIARAAGIAPPRY